RARLAGAGHADRARTPRTDEAPAAAVAEAE
ncbi:MAG: hypothetical protein ACI9YM_001113, partial [Brevundimonas sp.]